MRKVTGMKHESELYKVIVCIPPEYSDKLMDALADSVDPMYPGYDRAFTIIPVKGTWRTLEGSHPYNGKVGEITVADEVRIEFAVHSKDLKTAIDTILGIHPYEEPGIDILPMIGWKDVTDRP
jgi:hypothetical protein